MIFTYLQCLPRWKKPTPLKAPTDVVEDADAVAAVTATTTIVTTATTTIIMTTATIVDVMVDAIKSFKWQLVVRWKKT